MYCDEFNKRCPTKEEALAYLKTIKLEKMVEIY